MAVGGCGRFLGDRTKGLSYVQPRGTTARGGLVFHHADDHGPGGGVSGIPDQTVPGTLAGEGSQVCWPYGETHHPLGDKNEGDRTGAGRHARKQAARRLGVSIGAVHNWVKAYREGGMAALQARNRNAAQNGKTASAPCRSRDAGDGNDDTETLRRRVEELELENALMREVAEAVKKDPGANLRRLSNREKTLLIDRLRPTYSLSSMACLLGIAPSSHPLSPRPARG